MQVHGAVKKTVSVRIT